MRSYAELAPLRLRGLWPADGSIAEHDGWLWMGHAWRYEGVGFTWFGRLEAEPDATAAFELSFDELTPQQSAALAAALDLGVAPGMSLAELVAQWGPPVAEQKFVPDRTTHDFLVGQPDAYRVSATIHETNGLVHLSAIKAALAEA